MLRRMLTFALLAASPLLCAQSAPPPPAPAAGEAPQSAPPPPAPAAGEAPRSAASPAAAPLPAAEAAQAAARPAPPQGVAELLETHVEQVRQGNRVTEVRVTGADGAPRYTMENREYRPPSPLYGSGSGLSAPNFLNIPF